MTSSKNSHYFINRKVNDSCISEDLDSRLKDHNQGKDPHTSKFKPWKIKTAIAFTDRNQALEFERYLKTPSGRAFAKKRL